MASSSSSSSSVSSSSTSSSYAAAAASAAAASKYSTSKVLFLNERSLKVVKSKLIAYPPREPFAQFPLQTQVELVPFELTLELRLEGLWGVDESLAFPSVTCLLEDILVFSADSFSVKRRALDAMAWTLVEKANREYLLTDDEVLHLKQQPQGGNSSSSSSSNNNKSDCPRLKYALRYFPEEGNLWLDMMGSVDMMMYPSELSRWIQTSVASAFGTAARRHELIGQHKRLTLQLELGAPSERPFHLHLYLSSQDNDGDWDLAAWHHYVVMINARARRQHAKNAFYTILQLIRDHQNVPPPLVLAKSSSSSTSHHQPDNKLAVLLTNEHRKAAPSSKIDALRAKQDAAVLEVLIQFSQCAARVA